MSIRRPRRFIPLVGLIPPDRPSLPLPAREQLQPRPWAARLDQGVLLVRLAGVFALAGLEHVHLAAAGGQGAGVLAADAEQQDLGDVAEVEADAAAVGAAVLAHLVPDQVRLVGNLPRPQHLQPLG